MAAKKKVANASVDAQGTALVDLVIAKVKKDGLGHVGGKKGKPPRPVPPKALDALTFPDGSALSPSLHRWLSFDASWLAWFDDVARPVFKPKKLGQYARDEYEMEWGYKTLEPAMGGDCFGLHGGSDSRRFLYVGKPDKTGEHPVLLTDTDDAPFLCVQYPGIDVYLAVHAGIIESEGAYGSFAKDPRFAARMKEHAKLNLGGKPSIDLGYGAAEEEEEGEPPPWKEGDPVPEGFRVGINPMTGKKLLARK
jgi:hypothetical protein